MARPFKNRQIATPPAATVYKPAGVPASELTWRTLAIDELEAIRLVDAEGLDQSAVAERMGVSRPTVSRIVARARATIARTLTQGQALQIEGGPVEIASRRGQGARRRGQGRGRRAGRRRGGGARRRGQI
jgi:predicted DNA-binding protein (UPF0251 family)